jgi:archaellum component FlaC
MHFAGMGEACARFHPLTLDFRHPATGAAQDSVLWLRNGGGKTTLLSLFYSTLVPNQNHFLGRLLGKGTSLHDFLRLNEIGVIVSEWDFPAFHAPRRIIGQALQLKEHDLKRRFFSFAAVPDFGLEQLPVLGLGTPARSIDRIFDELREAEQRHPAMDLVIPNDQTEWEQHLERIGLDPFLFQMHLKMNKQEGGASDLFKLKAPEDFLRLFLELVFDERATEEIEKSLAELREKIARAPDRQAAIEFGTELLKSLRPFATEAAERERLRGEQQNLRREVASVAAALIQFLGELDKRQATLTGEQELWQQTLNDLKTKLHRTKRYVGGYERLGRLLLVEETEAALKGAVQMETEVRRREQVMDAAIALRGWSRKQAELDACAKQFESLQREHRPEWERIRDLGAEVKAAWQLEVSALMAARTDAEMKKKQAKRDLQSLHTNRAELKASQATAAANMSEAISALTRHDEGRRRLIAQEMLEPREMGASALARWRKKVDGLDAAAGQMRDEAEQCKAAIESAKSERSVTAKDLQQRDSELKETQQTIAEGDEIRTRTAALPALRELCEGTEPDLRNPHLVTGLKDVADAADSHLIELGIADFDDKRSLNQLERDGLLAPSVDISEVLRRVHDAGARSALSLYRWLAEHHSSAESLDLLRRHPAAYSGILVQNSVELEKARGAVEALNIKTPILLLTLDALPPARLEENATTHTVLPADHGLFSMREAALARPRIEERRLNRQTDREVAGTRAQRAREAATHVREFNEQWPQTRFDALIQAVATGKAEIDALTHALAAQDLRLAELTQRQSDNQRAQLVNARESGTAQGYVRELATFVADHESQSEHWRQQRELSITQNERFLAELAALDQEEPSLHEMEEQANQRWLDLSSTSNAATRSLANLPQEYVGSPVPASPEKAAAELEPEFYAAIAAYEGKVHKGELDGRIKELRNLVGDLRQDFERRRGNIDESEAALHMRRPALDADFAQQKENVINACATMRTAKERYDSAFAQKPEPREFKEGTDTDPSIPRPATSAECGMLVAKMQATVSEVSDEQQLTTEQAQVVERGIERVKSRRPLYTAHLDRFGKVAETALPPHPEFSDNDDANAALVNRVARQAEETSSALSKVDGGLRRRFEKEIHPLITDERFSKRTILFRERLGRLTFEDFLTQAERHVRGVDDQVKVCQSELEAQEQEKRILVQKLDVVARQAANLFDQAERVSQMPETMGAWAGQPFLRITLPRKNDPAERHVLLGQVVDRWFQPPQNIPCGYMLAFECLLALCGTKTANVRILKPEYQLRAVSHDIMDLVIFSDGEKLTTAIVLYCILVRLRARQKARAEHGWESDAGLLLLDNPFGKATLATFVDLQLRMARQMGVQLIYTTGVGDFGALKAFPHYVRLRNSSRGKATGDYHVTTDPRALGEDGHVEGVTLGFQRDGNLEVR